MSSPDTSLTPLSRLYSPHVSTHDRSIHINTTTTAATKQSTGNSGGGLARRTAPAEVVEGEARAELAEAREFPVDFFVAAVVVVFMMYRSVVSGGVGAIETRERSLMMCGGLTC